MNEFEKFRDISVFKGLNEEQVRSLFEICRRVIFQKNDVIMEEDEDRFSIYFFIDGEVLVTNVITMKMSNQAGYSEVEKSLVRLSADQVGVLGEMSVFEEQKRSATVKAYAPCILYEIDRKEFLQFLEDQPETGVKILFNIASILCARVRRGNTDILKLTTALSIALSR